MGKETTVTLGVANEGERNFKIDEVLLWEKKKMSYIGDSVFFEANEVFYSMKKIDYVKHFKK